MDNITFTNGPFTGVECDVDRKYLPHLLLIPAGIILTILAFLQQRRSFKKEVWGGRPGIVVPIDFLGMDHDRLAIMFVFGAATGSIVLLLISRNISGHSNVWEKAFLLIATCIEYAFLYYPYFGCLASYHRIIGALMGLPYAVTVFVVFMTAGFQECNGYTTHEYAAIILSKIPVILCHLFILGKFTLVLYKEIKENGTCGIQCLFHKSSYFTAIVNPDEQSEVQVKLVKPWLKDYVKDLINKPKPPRHYSRLEFFLRKIYNPEKNFKFSTQTLSVVMICSIMLYAISLLFVYLESLLLQDKLNNRSPDNALLKVLVKIERDMVG